MSKKKKKGKAVEFIPADNYVRIWRSMLESPAYRALSLLARRVLARLELEHLRHGGRDNGRLICSYAQLMEYCCTTDKPGIANALYELKGAGFIDFKPGKVGPASDRVPNEYRLTYIPVSDDTPATNDWAAIETIEEAQAVVREFGKRRGRSKWFNGAATDKFLKSGVKPKKIINSGSGKSVAKATPVVGPDQPSVVDTSPTTTPPFPVGPDQPETPNSRLVQTNSLLDATHIYPLAGPPVQDRPASEASPNGSTPNGGEIPAPVKSNGNGTHPKSPVSEIPPWEENDAVWFSANPERSYRLRGAFEGEADHLTPADDETVCVVVKQFDDSGKRRVRLLWPGNPLEDFEEMAKAMFGLVIELEIVPTPQQLIERIQLDRKGGEP
jgi:hypothetical protein